MRGRLCNLVNGSFPPFKGKVQVQIGNASLVNLPKGYSLSSPHTRLSWAIAEPLYWLARKDRDMVLGTMIGKGNNMFV